MNSRANLEPSGGVFARTARESVEVYIRRVKPAIKTPRREIELFGLFTDLSGWCLERLCVFLGVIGILLLILTSYRQRFDVN